MVLIAKNGFLNNVIHILTLIIILWALTPFLQRNMDIRFVIVFLMISVSFVIFSNLQENNEVPKYLLYSLTFVGIVLAYRLIGFSSAAIGNYLNLVIFFYFSWMYYFYLKEVNRRRKDQVIVYIIIVSAINLITNIYLLHLYPNASVELNYSNEFFRTNVGGTTFSYFVLILFMFFMLFKQKSKVSTISLNTILIILSLIYIFQASRATAIMLMILFVIFYIYLKITNKKTNTEKAVLFSIFTIFFIVLYFKLDEILRMSSYYVQNERLRLRLEAIVSALSSNNAEENSSLVSRIELYSLSLDTIFSSFYNFLFGVGYHTTELLSIEWLYMTGVGNHSEFLDVIARYGVLGSFTLFLFIFKFYKFVKLSSSSESIPYINLVVFIFVLYSIFNNSFSPSIGVLMFLLIPLYTNDKQADFFEKGGN